MKLSRYRALIIHASLALIALVVSRAATLPLAYADAIETPPPKAAPGFGALGNLGLFPTSMPTLTYAGWVTPIKDPADLEQNRLTYQMPVYHGLENDFSLSAGISDLHVGEPTVLDSSQIMLPHNLWKLEVGGNFLHRYEDNRIMGGSVSLGSASDHPFSTLDVTTVGLNWFYSWSEEGGNRWLVTLFFSNNNPILNWIPIPGFVYLHQTPTFVGMFGLPFDSFVWMPAKPWMFTLSAFGPIINSEIAYGQPAKAQIYTGFSWQQQSFLRAGRSDANERLYVDEKHVPIGFRFPAFGLQSDLSVGYAFDRQIYEGTHLRKMEDGSVNFASTWYAAWNFRATL